MRGVQLAARPHALAFVSAACSLLSCALAQTPGASPLAPLFPGFSTEAPSSDASSGTGDFGALGAFDTARSRVFIPATDGTAPPVAGVPDLGGEQGEVLCTHPVVHENTEPDVLFPLVLYLHPTHGLVFEAWIAQHDAMLRLLASRGFVVCAPPMGGWRIYVASRFWPRQIVQNLSESPLNFIENRPPKFKKIFENRIPNPRKFE